MVSRAAPQARQIRIDGRLAEMEASGELAALAERYLARPD